MSSRLYRMMSKQFGSWIRLGMACVLSLALGWGFHGIAMAQEPAQQFPNPQQFRALEQPDNPISFSRAEELSAQADAALQAQNFDEAIRLLEQVFDAFNSRSNNHQELGRAFAGIENQISESQRELAREAAQRRDQAAYDLAVVYRAAGRSEQSVNQLVQVVGSQGPTRDLGRQAYQQLYEIGFTSIPFQG